VCYQLDSDFHVKYCCKVSLQFTFPSIGRGPNQLLMSTVDLIQVFMFQVLVLVLAATSMCQQASSDANKVIRKRGLLHYTGLAFTPATNLGYPALGIHPVPAYTTIAYPRYGLRYPFAPTLPAYYPGFPIYG
jgi:hypothetical protein